ncbi:hypothetical protein [Teredinibacter purpureus]|uniref:hypothetical protein n=1 Tax=Teredinibacter purpureus TaxID=2731756 RepID=UPI0005F7960C|nr:hypothetical protein [Teredinibacter purpureus]
MVENLEFRHWLIQPGNHRIFQKFRQELKQYFTQDVEIKSWMDVYHLFEVALTHTEEAIRWFDPIIRNNPPSAANGATATQILLYRGAYVNRAELPTSSVNHAKRIMYRGQVMEDTELAEAAPENDAAEVNPPKKVRYYRGVKVES